MPVFAGARKFDGFQFRHLNLAEMGQIAGRAGRYTRDGTFRTNSQGEIVTADGYRLQPGFSLPEDTRSITIDPTGHISVTTGTDFALTEIGTLEIARFANPAALEAVGNNNYVRTAAAGEPLEGTANSGGLGSIVGLSLETSNVDIAKEFTDLLTYQRGFQANSRVITTADELNQEALNLKR